MKTTALSLLFFLMLLFNGADAQFSSGPKVISPEILNDNAVAFRLYAPDAIDVKILGEWMASKGFVAGSEAMVQNDEGIWSFTTEVLSPDFYTYSFTIDGVNALDPENAQVVRGGKTYSNYIIIPGTQSGLYEYLDVPHGTLHKCWYNSPSYGYDRRVYVYTPPGYENGDDKYPVLYLLHGGMEDEEVWVNKGRAIQILDNLIAKKKVEPMIVVMPNGHGYQKASQNDMKPLDVALSQEFIFKDAAIFSESVVEDIIPFIENTFRTFRDKHHRAIAGLSLGSINTQSITNNHPELFSYIGLFSHGIKNYSNDPIEIERLNKERVLKIEALKNSNYKLYWIGCGKDDFIYPTVVDLKSLLDKHNFEYVYRETPGGHTYSNWRIYLTEFLPLLFK